MAIPFDKCRILIGVGDNVVLDITGFVQEATIGYQGDGSITWELRGVGHSNIREEKGDEFTRKSLPQPEQEAYDIV